MSSLLFSTDPGTSSSPWIDFSGDTAYVGDATGTVNQITSVFNGTPKLSSNPGWPVTVSNNYNLTHPVLDSNQGLLMVGSLNGNLYQIAPTTRQRSRRCRLETGTSPGIIAPPIVDITNGTTFVVDADNGSMTPFLSSQHLILYRYHRQDQSARVLLREPRCASSSPLSAMLTSAIPRME